MILQLLAKAAESNHGRQLTPQQVKEVVTILQAMQYEIAASHGRLEAQTRLLSILLNQLGGEIDISADLYVEAENYVVNVTWSDEGDTINAKLYGELEMSEMQEDSEATSSGAGSQLSLQLDEGGQQLDGSEDPDEEE